MFEALMTAMLRKIIFMALLYGGYKVIDNFYFQAFDTDEVIKDDPKAIAVLLGLFAIALALAQ